MAPSASTSAEEKQSFAEHVQGTSEIKRLVLIHIFGSATVADRHENVSNLLDEVLQRPLCLLYKIGLVLAEAEATSFSSECSLGRKRALPVEFGCT